MRLATKGKIRTFTFSVNYKESKCISDFLQYQKQKKTTKNKKAKRKKKERKKKRN